MNLTKQCKKKILALAFAALLTAMCSVTIYAATKSAGRYDRYGDVKYEGKLSLERSLSWYDPVSYKFSVSGSDKENITTLKVTISKMNGDLIAQKIMANQKDGLQESSFSGKKNVFMAYGAEMKAECDDGGWLYIYVAY